MMDRIKSCNFPELSPEFRQVLKGFYVHLLNFGFFWLTFDFSELLNSDKQLIIVGVIGRSNLPNCNKMSCFDFFSCHASFVDNELNRKEVSFIYTESHLIIFYLLCRVELNSSTRLIASSSSFISRLHSTRSSPTTWLKSVTSSTFFHSTRNCELDSHGCCCWRPRSVTL